VTHEARVRADVEAASSDLVTASFALLLPDEPAPVRLMNTIWADRFGVYDALTTAGNVGAWLAGVAPDGDQSASGSFAPDRDDVARFRALRDALRRLAALLTDDTRPAAASRTTDVEQAVADVNHAVTLAPTWPQLTYRHGELGVAAAGEATAVQRALSALARQSVDLLTGPDRELLRACRAPGCVLYFSKDHPRREWCSTACGNRTRAARHYRRHRVAGQV
jgi:predicted RNA-binding Zn ribbon-like protein